MIQSPPEQGTLSLYTWGRIRISFLSLSMGSCVFSIVNRSSIFRNFQPHTPCLVRLIRHTTISLLSYSPFAFNSDPFSLFLSALVSNPLLLRPRASGISN